MMTLHWSSSLSSKTCNYAPRHSLIGELLYWSKSTSCRSNGGFSHKREWATICSSDQANTDGTNMCRQRLVGKWTIEAFLLAWITAVSYPTVAGNERRSCVTSLLHHESHYYETCLVSCDDHKYGHRSRVSVDTPNPDRELSRTRHFLHAARGS